MHCGRVVHSTVVKYLTNFGRRLSHNVMQTNNPESGFNSDHKIRQYAHGLLLESQFLPSNKYRLLGYTSKNGRLGGRRSETGSRNMAATQKMNFLTLVSYSLLQTLSLGRTVLTQYKTSQTTDRQRTQCTIGSTDSMVGQKLVGLRTWKECDVTENLLFAWNDACDWFDSVAVARSRPYLQFFTCTLARLIADSRRQA